MQENHLFEYAVIRIVPKVEREEFMNTGVILYCARQRFLKTMFTLNEERLRAFCRDIDIDEVQQHLRSFQQVAEGGREAGVIGTLDVASRFRWLTATRSTVVQCSKVHPGLCKDPLAMLHRLHEQLVLC